VAFPPRRHPYRGTLLRVARVNLIASVALIECEAQLFGQFDFLCRVERLGGGWRGLDARLPVMTLSVCKLRKTSYDLHQGVLLRRAGIR
jgi:hypothetical protein